MSWVSGFRPIVKAVAIAPHTPPPFAGNEEIRVPENGYSHFFKVNWILKLIRFFFLCSLSRLYINAGKVLWKVSLFKQSSRNLPQNHSCIELRVLLSTPISVASAETSFSNRKIINNVLRSTMLKERLPALGIISLGYEVARSLDFDVLIDKFAQKTGQRKNFLK